MRRADYRCLEFDRRLQEGLDERMALEHDEELAEHSAACEPCRDRLESAVMLLEAIRLGERPEPSSDLADRVCRRVKTGSRRREARWMGVGLSAGALAAAVLVAIAPWPRSAPTSITSRSDRVETGRWERTGARPKMPTPNGTRVGGTPSPATEGGTEPASDVVRDLFETFTEQLGVDPLPPLRHVNEITTVGFRPIASSFGSAFSALRNSLPVFRDDERPKPQASVPSMRLIA